MGRQAVAEAVGVLGMADVHHRSLGVLLTAIQTQDARRLVERASAFFSESPLPFIVVEQDRVEKASQVREDLVTILSCELRPSLMIILGWSSILATQPELKQGHILGEGVRALEHNA